MIKASDIITKSRQKLSDTIEGSYRWSDIRLLSLLNDAILDIASSTLLYNDITHLNIIANQSVYNLSDKIFRLNRVEYQNKVLSFKTSEEMDKVYGDWQTTTGKPEYIIYNLHKMGEFRLYPIPEEGIGDSFVDDSLYGGFTELHLLPINQIVISGIDNGAVGGITDILFNLEYLTIYSIKFPDEVSEITTELDVVITRPMIEMLANYVAGHAFRDDQAEQNVRLGSDLLFLYNQKKMELSIKKSTHGIKKIRKVNYNPLGIYPNDITDSRN